MDSQKRLLIALGLSFALTVVYMLLFAPKSPPGQAGRTEGAVSEPRDAGAAVTAAAAPPVLPDAGVLAEQTMPAREVS